jgi:glycerol-3-phosphate acyltransferase PlsY
METIFAVLGSLIIGYVFGSIPFGLVLTRLAGYGDIRQIGSGNIGATNVLRTGNKPLAFLTLMLDIGKGAFAIGIGYFVLGLIQPDFIALGAVIGHCFPVWLNFKGGKGVATTIGTLLASVPLAGLAAIIAWLIAAKIWRISSLAALIAMAVAPVVALFAYGFQAGFVCALISGLVAYRHKDNIERLRSGTEPKIGDKKDVPDATAAD